MSLRITDGKRIFSISSPFLNFDLKILCTEMDPAEIKFI